MNNNEVGNSPGDDHDAVIRQKSMFASPQLIVALIIVSVIAVWGLADIAGLAAGDLNPGIHHPVWNPN